MAGVCGKCGKRIESIPDHAYAVLCTDCGKIWASALDGSRGSFYYYRRSNQGEKNG